MYIHRIGYRHANGEVEGFVGWGISKNIAVTDCIAQIKRKIAIISDDFGIIQPFDGDSLIYGWENLNDYETRLIKADWSTKVRYTGMQPPREIP